MRLTHALLCAVALSLPAVPAAAAERGSVIRAGELKATPFIDAATAARVSANQEVTVLSRKGGWVEVETGGQTGWVRMLNVRMRAEAGNARGRGNAGGAAFLRTGSSGRTVTTGIKGMGEEDIRRASVDRAGLAILASLAVPSSEAVANARQSGLKEHEVPYLAAGEDD